MSVTNISDHNFSTSNLSTAPASHASTTQRFIQALRSDTFMQVEQRIIRQLIQALLYEEILPYDTHNDSVDNGDQHFILSGKDITGRPVQYRSVGKRMNSFGRIRLVPVPIIRVGTDGSETSATLADFANEVLSTAQQGERLQRFIEELEQTLLKDVQAQSSFNAPFLADDQRRYDELEGNLGDGHPYHPCYKSRIGFTLADNELYGPEFKQPLRPVWLAIAKSHSRAGQSQAIEYEAFIRQELGESEVARFQALLTSYGQQPEAYRLMPVHPWQWQQVILPRFHQELANQRIVWLGEASDVYQAQQSIRTLSNRTTPERAYVKLSLSITNTSTSRIMAGHTVLNGALITDWLYGLLEHDEYAAQQGFFVLREVLGITYDYEQLPEYRQAKTYGSLGTVWRESIHGYLQPDEDAIPFNGLCYVQKNGVPLIDPWVQQFGVEEWTRRVLEATISPIIHMLFAHGIGMESHGQNIILIHRNGQPTRVALKDFHDGVRFSVKHLTEPEKCPDLHPEPPSHARINRNSFIKTSNPDDVRDFSYDAFFFIAAAELAMFLAEHYQLDEQRFWEMSAQVIHDYQRQHPQHEERFRLFDLFAPTVQIEELMKRRLLGDEDLHFKPGMNPLYVHREPTC
ncbi:IucA/IucC family protein [Paenibacillus sp. 23TSA30-6]|uniref:IucA/IucC family protein n=1 Tax=Paenibacillus sp. 23TSA30-6 TaxID=2546104 RepID=UPI001788508B|nr:IucA/IucC family siderophore biosynthesis protein [Paenibacillus sp. 23TSA30-6]MBE0338270.1 IucA/IucC family siderophore biosynthesis protein [Paenibacillus sp. 23TSA30-6]